MSAYFLSLMPDPRTSKQPEMRLQFAAAIERRFQRRSKPEIEGQNLASAVIHPIESNQSCSLISIRTFLQGFTRFSRESTLRNASTWTSLKLLQIYDMQLDQRNLLHFVLSPGAEFPSSPGPGAYLSRLPKCAY